MPDSFDPVGRRRRHLLLASLLLVGPPRRVLAASSDLRWIETAESMKRLALSWGDQPYGAVLVKDDRIIGYGPSRVVKHRDPDAHAEREAIKHALTDVGAVEVKGSILYSTSRPCALCETAAAKAGVVRMVYGPDGADAGAPALR